MERKIRADHELKIEVLEQVLFSRFRLRSEVIMLTSCGGTHLQNQEVRSTRAKCNYLDAKYQGVLVQMDDMVRRDSSDTAAVVYHLRIQP